MQRGATFKVFCTFNCKCGAMYTDHPPRPQSHQKFNSTTIQADVVNISQSRTFSCSCNCLSLDPCGLDISAGYPPERPKKVSCIHKVTNNDTGVVLCKWDGGRETYIQDNITLWVRPVFGNHSGEVQSYPVPIKKADPPSVSFTVSSGVQLISVWVHIQNPLGAAESEAINYNLSDIAMPSTPVLGQPECSSRECVIHVQQSLRTEQVEIQYGTKPEEWNTRPNSGLQMTSNQSVPSLEPDTLYHFRARSKFSSGMWSQWSANVSSWTQEEAPAKALDVWYAAPASDFTSSQVYWKAMNNLLTRGKIIDYIITVSSSNSGVFFERNVSADLRNYSVPYCLNCEVTVCARNSKGLSPPAKITPRHTTGKPSLNVQVMANNHSVTVKWSRKPETAAPSAACVVEWYPEGHMLEELKWLRVGGNVSQAVITDVEPFECYAGAVYVFHGDGSVAVASFSGVSTVESAPTEGPAVVAQIEQDTVKLTWQELPRDQRRGCITTYSLYLENINGHLQNRSQQASQRAAVFGGLSPSTYSLSMTASTARGEGPPGQKVKFLIQQDTALPYIVMFPVCTLVLCLICVCQLAAVKQRLWLLLQCFMLDVVPDPANSKWAKECTKEKGGMALQLEQSQASITEEEELILADVEELPKQSCEASSPTGISSPLLPKARQRPGGGGTTLLYPVTTYIKNISHDSDSSGHTHTSLDTTVGYISSHEPGDLDEEEQERQEGEEEEDEIETMLEFFPSQSIFIDPQEFGGKLTLDAIKIDCGDLFLNR